MVKPAAAQPGSTRGGPRFPAALETLRSPSPTALRAPATAAAPPSGQRPPTPSAAQAAAGVGLDSAAVRRALVQRLAQQGLRHEAVLAALTEVERHRFVDSALVAQAYVDTALPIGWGQTISKPSVVGRMLELLCAGRALPLGRVLEIGTGSGYQAALLARLCREVYSIERIRGLHDRARELLRPLRIPNLHLIFGDGMLGYPAGAPYAGIIAAAGGEAIPPAWLQQLQVGARLVAPAEVRPGHQRLVVVERTASGWQRQELEGVHFVPLQSGVLA